MTTADDLTTEELGQLWYHQSQVPDLEHAVGRACSEINRRRNTQDEGHLVDGLRGIIANRNITVDQLTTELANKTELSDLAERAMNSAHEASKGFQRLLEGEQANQWPLYQIADAARAYVESVGNKECCLGKFHELQRALSRAPNDAAELSVYVPNEVTDRVRKLGETIGFGRLMQTAEQVWHGKAPGGGALSVGPCVMFLVECPCPESGRDQNGHCEWCCGSGRVTKRVRLAIEALP